jgi:hypothetical protein
LVSRLDGTARQLGVDLAARREADAELEALRILAAQVRGLVLDNANGSSSLAASMLKKVELLKGQIDAAAANGSTGGPVLHWLLPCRISQS